MDKIFGKKVFFIYPNSVIQVEMVAELIKCEYEVYLIKDYDKALTIFHRYPESVVFINIDEGQEESQWEEYVQTIKNDPDMEAVQVGIMTYNDDPELAQKYLMDIMVSGGFIKLSLGLKESTALVLKVLEANEARGRRKFLRVQHVDHFSSLNAKLDDKPLNGTVVDISSAGMACTFDHDVPIPARTVIDSIQLKLKGILCLVSGIVMGSRMEGDHRIYVLLFGPKTPPDNKDKIRTFMQWALQHQIEEEIEAIS